MRRIAVFVTVATIGLMLALSIGGGANALLREVGSGNIASAFSNNDKDKDKDKNEDNGGGNGNGNAANNGNGNSADNGNGSGADNAQNGNGNGGDNAENGNGNGGDNAANGNGNSSANNGRSDDNSENRGQSGNAKNDNNNGQGGSSDEGDDSGTSSPGDENAKVLVCHLTERDDFPYNLIEISENALPAHEDHGDFLAPEGSTSSNDCEEGATPPPVGSPGASEPESPPEASPEAVEKVRVCHATSSETNPFILIEVSADALPAHEGHGDFLAPDDAVSSNDCEDEVGATPVASPEGEPIG